MADREKVMRGAECCTKDVYDPFSCEECPYLGHKPTKKGCISVMLEDVIALLKGQEPRVLTLEEIRSGAFEVVWLEDADKPNVVPGIWFRLSNEGGDEAVDIHVIDGFVGARLAVYGKTWRAWISRPSPEQMRETPWEASNETL